MHYRAKIDTLIEQDEMRISAPIHGYGYTAVFLGDYNDLVYLRARHYAPGMGRFLTRDTWDGDDNNPISFNFWNYAYSNPTNLTDPTGNFPAECLEAPNFAECLRNWIKEGHDECSLTPTNLQFIGNFNLSA